MRDTTAEADAIVVDAIRRQTPAQRLRAMLALSESVRAVAMQRLRARYPHASAVQLAERLTGESFGGARAGPVRDR